MEEKVPRFLQVQQRKENVLSHALSLFCTYGIEETSIEQIAKAAQIGPASIYRYFETKAELAIECGIYYWKKTSEKYIRLFESADYQNQSGYGQVKCIFDLFQKIFLNESAFLCFLQGFDIFVKKYQISKERLMDYESLILNLKCFFVDALQKGLTDGSLYFEQSADDIYFSLMHTFVSLMQKLSVHGDLLSSDHLTEGQVQLQIISEIILKGLQKA